ncbi:MAG: PilT/PilU family type 4a pilus ATPase [Acidobacteriota bacterium]
MALGTLFKSGSKDLLEKIQRKDFSSAEEKELVYESLAHSSELRLVDVLPFLFSTEGELRRAVARFVERTKEPETVPILVGLLKGRPEAARRAALAQLASVRLPGDTLAAQLGALVTEAKPEQRSLAADALLDLPLSPETVPHLTQLIETGGADHRLKAVSRFADVATAQHLSFFEKLLDDGDERIRLAAWRTLVKFVEDRHLRLIVARIGDEPYGTQLVLIEALETLAARVGLAAVEPVLELLSSGNNGLRGAALRILLAMPERVEVVKRFITASQQLAGWVRDRALESLREFGDEVIEPVVALLADPDRDVRGAALGLLSNFEDPRIAPAVTRLLADEDWWLAINAADLLGRLGQPAAGSVPALVQALSRDELRWAAVEALGRIGGEDALKALSGLTEDSRPEIRIEAMTGLAASKDPRVTPVLTRVAESDPIKWVRARAFELVTELSRERSDALDEEGLRRVMNTGTMSNDVPAIHRLLAMARREGASDLHVSVDSTPLLRRDGGLVALQGDPLQEEQVEQLLRPLLTTEQARQLAEHHQLDACFYVDNDGRYRASLFRDRKGLNAVFRVIPEKPPTIHELGLPSRVADIAIIHQGIIIVTGPAGCGKSTTLAALVNLVNETRRAHVLTMEDPVEFVHPFKSSLVNQREIGKHSKTYGDALRAALREDPDVIVIGEMRDPDTISLALTAAETGHVVLTTLNATTAHAAVDRIIASFPVDEQGQVRESFAGALKLIVAQGLVPRADGKGRTACFELLWSTGPIANAIRDGKTFQIPSLMQIGRAAGLCSFDDALLELLRTGVVSAEDAYMRAQNREAFAPYVSEKFLEELLD